MIPMLVMTFREGIESFLIVAVTLAYLRKTGRDALVPAAWWGAVAACAASAGAGWLFAQAENQPLWEGTLALVAALLVGSMVVYMLRAAQHISGEIRARLDSHAAREGFAARLGVFAFVLLMITREGMELALIAGSLATQTGVGDLLAGALAGVAAAIALAWAWQRYGRRIDLGRFFKVTAIYLLLFVAQLMFYAFHEFTETGLLPIDNEYWHLATEPWSPEGQYGIWVTVAMLAIPLAWLALSFLRTKPAPRSASARAA